MGSAGGCGCGMGGATVGETGSSGAAGSAGRGSGGSCAGDRLATMTTATCAGVAPASSGGRCGTARITPSTARCSATEAPPVSSRRRGDAAATRLRRAPRRDPADCAPDTASIVCTASPPIARACAPLTRDQRQGPDGHAAAWPNGQVHRCSPCLLRLTACSRHLSKPDRTVILLPMRHTGTRDHLISTGLQVLHARGFHASGVQDITDAAQVPKGSFYTHFESKEQFGAEVLGRYWERRASSCHRHPGGRNTLPAAAAESLFRRQDSQACRRILRSRLHDRQFLR